MSFKYLRRVLFILTLALLSVDQSYVLGFHEDADLNVDRARLIAREIRQNMPRHHYSHKEIDDSLSRAAFALYLKQLDFQKRFLLAGDVERLRAYENSIDEEINLGDIELPGIAAGIMKERVVKVQALVEDIMSHEFDIDKEEFLETDAEKLEPAGTYEELRDRWRRSLKYQVLNRYLNLEEDEAFEAENPENGKNHEKKDSATLRKEAREKVLKSYEDLFSRMQKETDADYTDRYFNAIARAFDPHTNYLPPEKKEDFDISMRGSLEGIGALLREEDGYIKIVRIIPGSAAYRQGQLQAEDIILKVGQGADEPVDITGMKLREAVGLIRGKKGTEVRLTVKHPDGARSVIPIIRDVVEIEETFVKSAILEQGDNEKTRIGYIKIPTFYRDFLGTRHGGTGRNSTDDVRAELERLKGEKIQGLVLDLRNNGGGALTDAVQIAGLFIDTGPVVQVKGSDGRIKIHRDTEKGVVYEGPMVLLVNKFSASASEILAGALQDYNRAVVMGGEHTHGKGTVQTMFDVDMSSSLKSPEMAKYKPLGALKVTIQKFYRVSGDSTQYRGVVPDIVLPDKFQHLKTGERHLEYSLPWDRVEPASFSGWTGPGADLSVIRQISMARVKASEEFAGMEKESIESAERMKQTLVSLDIDDVRREREELAKEKEQGTTSVFHGQTGHGLGEDSGKRMTEEEKHKAWLKELGEDPYVVEGEAVLRDILSSASGVAAGIESAPGKM